MKINYKILWIDDQIDNFIDAGLKDDFINYLENLGFEAIIHYFDDAERALEKIHEHKYDLILSDYNIDENHNEFKGDELINRIRQGDIFTEVLFYSAQSNFNAVATNLYQDRVSFFNMASSDAYREFKGKVIKLIGLTVSKFQEINSMRGLVMAQTSELDSAVENILVEYFAINNANADKLLQYILKCIESSLRSNVKTLANLQEKGYSELVKSRIFDADKKARAINKMLSFEGLDKEDHLRDFYDMYKRDVLDSRNNLAHARSETIDGIDYLIVSGAEGEQPVRMTEEACREIRTSLRKYTGLLREVKSRVCVKSD